MKNTSVPLLRMLLLMAVFIWTVNEGAAQVGGVDLSFKTPLSRVDTSSGHVGELDLQPDGKILILGSFQIVNGAVRNRLARLNADGTLDESFRYTVSEFNIMNLLLQPDGKILLGGYSGTENNTTPRVVRLNADGTADSSFVSPFGTSAPPIAYSNATVQAIQPDGKILVMMFYNSGAAGTSTSLVRLHPNGAVDNSFATVTFFAPSSSGGEYISKVLTQPDGKIYISTAAPDGSRGFLRRYDSGGVPDTTFTPPVLAGAGSSANFSLEDFDIRQPGGEIVIVGRFSQVNGINRTNIARLLPNGTVDPAFAPQFAYAAGEYVSQVSILADGGILTSIRTLTALPRRLARFKADGTADASFATPSNLVLITDWLVAPSGRILLRAIFAENGVNVWRFAWLNPNGTIETLLNTNVGIGGYVIALAVQADGKILLTGIYDWVDNVPRQKLVRLNANGSVDTTFNPNFNIFTNLSKIVPLANGQILVSGNFSDNGNGSSNRIKRLNSDGSADPAFDVNLSIYPTTFAVQPDGKIVIGGYGSPAIGQTTPRVIRLNADGTPDNFNPTFSGGGLGGSIRSLVIEPDGKIVVGGPFNSVNGSARSGIARLNANGSLDQSFDAGSFGAVGAIERLADGKYLVAANGVFRLNNNGTPDPAFQSVIANDAVNALFVESNGNIIIGGSFTTVGGVPRSRIARLTASGIVDANFLPAGADNIVTVIAGQPGGKVIVAGYFSTLQNLTRLGIARLSAAPPAQFDFDGDRRSDISLFRPSNGTWYLLPSQTNAFYGFPFGQSGDLVAPADYDGDGKTDVAVFRPVVAGAGDQAYFYILNSADNSFRAVGFGTSGDVPVPGDWDGDGKADLAVYRAASAAGGQSNFYYRPSSQPAVNFYTLPLGTLGDKPVAADYDGDGRIDPAVFRPSSSVWIILRSSLNQISQTNFGVSTDIPVPADFDGDGQANIAVFRPSNGTWYTSPNPATNYGAIVFGANGDLPVAADYDGDGKADAAVFRPSDGGWYLNRTTSGLAGVQFGANGDKPAPNAFIR